MPSENEKLHKDIAVHLGPKGAKGMHPNAALRLNEWYLGSENEPGLIGKLDEITDEKSLVPASRLPTQLGIPLRLIKEMGITASTIKRGKGGWPNQIIKNLVQAKGAMINHEELLIAARGIIEAGLAPDKKPDPLAAANLNAALHYRYRTTVPEIMPLKHKRALILGSIMHGREPVSFKELWREYHKQEIVAKMGLAFENEKLFHDELRNLEGGVPYAKMMQLERGNKTWITHS
ncbi:MAG: hypothetical protein AABX01_03445 [Candidatus Micrarchaeota archaeon]